MWALPPDCSVPAVAALWTVLLVALNVTVPSVFGLTALGFALSWGALRIAALPRLDRVRRAIAVAVTSRSRSGDHVDVRVDASVSRV